MAMVPEKKLPLILASASPRRQELLRLAGVPFEVIPSQVEEKLLSGESPEEYVIRLARMKAVDVAKKFHDRWVLGADTAVVIDGRMLGKPKDRREAKEMMEMLSRREHLVITGYCILNSTILEKRAGKVTTRVRFKPLSSEEIRWYLNTGEPYDKAGGYAIQGKAAFMVQEIQGSYTNVVGLPLCEVIEALQGLGVVDRNVPDY